MVNYYKQFKKIKEQEKLLDKTITLDAFENIIRSNFGFGNRKTITKWLNNFKNIGYIDIKRNDVGDWMVQIK
jgi:hypothetical protein